MKSALLVRRKSNKKTDRETRSVTQCKTGRQINNFDRRYEKQ